MHDFRRLVLVRHAQAAQSSQSDDRRELTDAGRATAAAQGRWLADSGIQPDHALVSAAVRAEQTWQEMAAAAGWDLDAESSPGLYSAEPDTALDLVSEAPEEARTVVVVGHNPTMASLAQMLDDGTGDPAAQQQLLTGGFPAGALAVFEYDGSWSDLQLGSARLVAVHLPED